MTPTQENAVHHQDPPFAPRKPAAIPPHPGLLRASAAIAAATVTFALFAGLLVTFDTASPRHWLAPTQQVLELVEGCDGLVDAAQREHCKRRVVTTRLSTDSPPVQLARR